MDKLTKYDNLIKYMVDNEINLSKSIEIRSSDLGGVGVFAKIDIPPDTLLLQVPKSEVLSPSTCGIANLLHSAQLDGMIGLTVAYIFEKCQGKASPWFEYLETIHSSESLPRFWSNKEKSQFSGTEIEFMGGLDTEEINDVFENSVLPFMRQNISCFPNNEKYMNIQGYIEAVEQVSSRAFEVDVFRGLSLVPGACLFNHGGYESVHFVSQSEVCDICGEEYCDHIAYEEIEQARNHMKNSSQAIGNEKEIETHDMKILNIKDLHTLDSKLLDSESIEEENSDEEDDDNDEYPDTCDIVSVKLIPKGTEILNTYGYYSNGILLARYGFAIWDNPHETISVTKELVSLAKSLNLYSRIKWWSKNYQHYLFQLESEGSENEFNEDDKPTSWQETLEILSNGQLSLGLEKLLTILSLSPNKYLATQAKAKKGNFSLSTVSVGKMALAIISKRAARYHDGNMSSIDYERVLETTDDSKTRLIAIVRGTEKLVLERAKLLLKK